MKRIKKIFLALLLFSLVSISLSAVSASDINNGTGISENNNTNNAIQIDTIQNLNTDNNLSTNSENNSISNTTQENNTTVTKGVNITIENFTQTFKTPKNLTVTVVNATNGHPIIGQHIALNITRINSWSKVYWVTTDINGKGYLNIGASPGTYNVNATYADGKAIKNITVNKILTGLIQYNFEVNRRGEQYRTILFNQYGNLLSGQTVYFTLTHGKNSKTYSKVTDNYGYAVLPINLNAGKFTITCTYNGNSINYGCQATNNITIYPTSHKMPTTITASGVNNNTVNIAKGKSLTLNIRENNGLLIPQAKLTVQIYKLSKLYKKYYVTTGNNGFGNLPINLAVGSYTVKYSYAGNTYFQSSTTTNNLIVTKA